MTEDHITEHFLWSEFASHDGVAVPDELRPSVMRIAAQLEILRAIFLGRPITILSGYRTASHNAAVGGAPHSQHMLGTAADVTIADLTPAEVADAVERAIMRRDMTIGGIGRYAGWTHLDVREGHARWNG